MERPEQGVTASGRKKGEADTVNVPRLPRASPRFRLAGSACKLCGRGRAAVPRAYGVEDAVQAAPWQGTPRRHGRDDRRHVRPRDGRRDRTAKNLAGGIAVRKGGGIPDAGRSVRTGVHA